MDATQRRRGTNIKTFVMDAYITLAESTVHDAQHCGYSEVSAENIELAELDGLTALPFVETRKATM